MTADQAAALATGDARLDQIMAIVVAVGAVLAALERLLAARRANAAAACAVRAIEDEAAARTAGGDPVAGIRLKRRAETIARKRGATAALSRAVANETRRAGPGPHGPPQPLPGPARPPSHPHGDA